MTRTRRLRGVLVAASAAVIGLVLSTVTPVTTDAAWTDGEWTHAPVSTLDCTEPTGLTSRGTGRILTAELANASLDSVIALRGLQTVNDGMGAAAEPASATDLGDDAFRSDLGLGVIGDLIAAEVGAALPLALGTGVYSQYAQAHPDGRSSGAAGVVTDQGAVDLDAIESGQAPAVGELRLSDLVIAGPVVGVITDLILEIGAVGAAATLDGCEEQWTGPSPATVQREYGVAGLDLDAESPAVSTLSATLDTTVGALLTEVSAAVSGLDDAITQGVVARLTSFLGGLVSGLRLGDVSAVVSVSDIDLTSVTRLLTEPLTDGAVTIDLAGGRIGIDLAAIVGELEGTPGDGLNNLPPNTAVLSSEVLSDVLDRVTGLLHDEERGTGLIMDIQRAVQDLLLGVTVAVDASVQLRPYLLLAYAHVADLNVSLRSTIGGLVGDPRYPAPSVTAGVAVLPSLGGLLLDAVNGILSGLTQALVTPAANGLLQIVSDVVGAVIFDPILEPDGGLLGQTISVLADSVTTLVTALDGALDFVGEVASISVNAQPDQPPFPAAPGGAEPGEYAVSALRVGVLDVGGGGATSLLNLFLASATVGPNAR